MEPISSRHVILILAYSWHRYGSSLVKCFKMFASAFDETFCVDVWLLEQFCIISKTKTMIECCTVYKHCVIVLVFISLTVKITRHSDNLIQRIRDFIKTESSHIIPRTEAVYLEKPLFMEFYHGYALSTSVLCWHCSHTACNDLMPRSCFCFQPLTHVCAKNLATFVSQEAGNRPVLLGLALKDSSLDSIKHMKEIIKSCQVW